MRRRTGEADQQTSSKACRALAGSSTAALAEKLKAHVVRLKRAAKGLGITTATIAALRAGDGVTGYQLRLGTKVQRGLTAHFSVRSFGSERRAQRAAREVAEALGLTISKGRGGSVAGRRSWRSSSAAPGIRFFWLERVKTAPVLFVGTSWREGKGKLRTTCFSTATNGLHGAVERAIEKRVAAGCPIPDRAVLVREARKLQREGPPA